MAMPPLQTRFQLWVARVQKLRVAYSCWAGWSPFSTSARRIVVRSSGAEGVVQPVVADREGVGHLGDVEEVGRVPVREAGGGQQLLAGAGGPARSPSSRYSSPSVMTRSRTVRLTVSRRGPISTRSGVGWVKRREPLRSKASR